MNNNQYVYDIKSINERQIKKMFEDINNFHSNKTFTEFMSEIIYNVLKITLRNNGYNLFQHTESKIYVDQKLDSKTMYILECQAGIKLEFNKEIDKFFEKTFDQIRELVGDALNNSRYDISEELIETMKRLEKINEPLHLPQHFPAGTNQSPTPPGYE